ncbi:carbohydrate sulfotransferase 8 isoform X2 [Pogona vitticeps]
MANLLEKFFIFLLFSTLLSILLLQIFPSGKTEITDPEEDWLKRQHGRRDTLNSTCLNKTSSRSASWQLDDVVVKQLFVEESHKFIYCEVPKVGCSNWKKILVFLTLNMSRDSLEINHSMIHRTNIIRRLNSYPSEKQAEFLNTYTKVMFSRHPFERLVSAYRDKLLHSEPYYSTTVANEIKAFAKKDQNTNEKVTFQDFVNYILSRNPKVLDIHWKPMHLLCDPCHIQYDIVGKYETLAQDADHILRRIGAPGGLQYSNSKVHSTEKRTDKNITLNYLRELNQDQMQKLKDLYQIDASLFSYSLTLEPETQH